MGGFCFDWGHEHKMSYKCGIIVSIVWECTLRRKHGFGW